MTDDQPRAAARRELIISMTRDAMVVVGIGLFALGVYQVYVPAGHMALGALLAAMGLRGLLRG
jgi:hypothetical protein